MKATDNFIDRELETERLNFADDDDDLSFGDSGGIDGPIIAERYERISPKEYELAKQQWIDRTKLIAEFGDSYDIGHEERIKRAKEDPMFFAKTYLPLYFETGEQAEWHPELIELWRKRDAIGLCTATRGGAKSTICSFMLPLWAICTDDPSEDFIVLVMDSKDKAELYTLRILTELQHNRRIIEDFGRLVSMQASRSNFATKLTPERPHQIRMAAWGDGMSMRGLVSNHSRPSRIIVEDLQDREKAESEKVTNKQIRLVKNDYIPAMRAHNYAMTILGNIICDGSMIDQFFEDEESGMIKLRFPAEVTDEFGNRRATWPALMPLEWLDRKRKEIGEEAYVVEYLCEAREANSEIKRTEFKHYATLPLPGYTGYHMILGQIDPSFSATGDKKAFAIGALYVHDAKSPAWLTWRDPKGERYEEGLYLLILALYNRQDSIDTLLDLVYEWNDIYSPKYIWIDGTFGQKTIFRKFFANLAIKKKRLLKNIHYQIFKTDKVMRIKAALPALKSGNVLLPPTNYTASAPCIDSQKRDVKVYDVKDMITEFVRLGKNGVKDDAPETIAALIENFDRHGKEKKGAKFHS